MSGILYLNGNDAKTTYGFEVVDAPDLLGMGEHVFQTAPVVQRGGVILGTAKPTVEAKRLRIAGFLTGSSLADARAKLDTLRGAIGTAPCSIRTGWDTTREFWGVLVASPAGPNSAYWQTYLSVELEFLLFDPYAYSTSLSTVNFTTATAIPLGTAPAKGNVKSPTLITISGAATTPILTYKSSAGVTLATMSFTGYSPLSGDKIEINLSKGLVEKIVSSVRSNAMGALAAGWNFPALDPVDGVYSTSSWPTLEVNSGSGTITYYKAYR